jgi:LysM repeat protein
MNAMRAAALPQYTQYNGGDANNEAGNRPRPRPPLRMVYRAESPFPVPAAPERPTPASPTPASPTPVRPAQARPVEARQAQARPAQTQARISAPSPLRLTRRGRVVLAAAVALLVVVVSLAVALAAQATSHTVVGRAAHQGLTQVVVRPGQSLWSVAESADPNADTRVVIQQITELNGLSGDTIVAGQQLWVPRS